MIVYNVSRQFFTMQADADTYRKKLGLKPSALLKITVNSRDDLAALLNALCAGPASNGPEAHATALQPAIAPPALIDAAFVPPSRDVPECVPRFLVEAWAKLGSKSA